MVKEIQLRVALNEEEISSLLSENMSIAAINAPEICVVSGRSEDIEDLQKLPPRKRPYRIL